MKRVGAGIVALLAITVACGGDKSGPKSISGLKFRAFVTNSFGGSTGSSGFVQVVDATRDLLFPGGISGGIFPTLMDVSPNREVTIVFSSGANQVGVIANLTETVGSTGIFLSDFAESIVAKDASTGFAAVPNAASGSPLGAVEVLDLANLKVTSSVSVPHARTLVMNPAATKLLVFGDDYTPSGCGSATSLTVFDIATSIATPICGFNQKAVWGVFGTDGNTAFIMNCGAECGGTAASVQTLNMSALPATPTSAPVSEIAGTPVPVGAATVGILNGSTLYVARTPGGVQGALQGVLNAFDVSSGTPVPSATVSSVPIGDGRHRRMALASNNKIFIGATECTNNPGTNTGCLSIFDTGTNAAKVDVGRGFVTGMAPITGRSVVYVCEGRELLIYDTTTSEISTGPSINIVGDAVDVKLIDPPPPAK